MLGFFVQHPEASKKHFLCFFVTCLQDDEIAYYNAKDNVSVHFLPSSVNLFSFSLSPCKHIGHTCIMNVLLLHSIPTPPSLPHIPSSPSFYSCKNHHICVCFHPLLSLIVLALYCSPQFAASWSFSSYVATSLSSLLPASLR